MRFVSIKELSRSPSRYVNLATEGECVIIPRNGKPTALLAEMNEGAIEDFILARHLDLESEFRRAQKEHTQGETASAEAGVHADKSRYREIMDGVFSESGIDVSPIDAEKLQEQMRELNLESNELSRDLIAAREA